MPHSWPSARASICWLPGDDRDLFAEHVVNPMVVTVFLRDKGVDPKCLMKRETKQQLDISCANKYRYKVV